MKAIGNIQILDSEFVDNWAYDRGGGLFFSGISTGNANLLVSGTTFRENLASSSGGAIHVQISSNQSANIINSTIVSNTAYQDGGGISGLGSVKISNSQILDNVSQKNGGGIRHQHVTLENSVVSGNKTKFGDGGGIYVTGNLIVRSSTISGNSAGSDAGLYGSGGGIFRAQNGTTAIESSTISANFAAKLGGGIGTSHDSKAIDILQTTISGNTSRSGGGIGGGIRGGIRGGTITLRHSTVTDNSAIFYKGDLGAFGGINASAVTLDHSIVANNREMASTAPDVFGTITTRYSLIGNNKGTKLAEAPVGSPDANGDLIGGPMHGVIDPKLGPLVNNGGFLLPDGSRILTRALLPSSPVINAGDPAASAGQNGVPLNDERGAPFTRVYGGRIDMGAFESQPNPLPGDYNFNGVVDMADYTLWRNTLGSTSDLRADGDGDGIVNEPDRLLWRTHFGEILKQIASMLESSAGGFTQVTKRPVNLQTGLSPESVEARSAATSEAIAGGTSLSFDTPPSKSVKRPAVTRRGASASSDEAVRRDNALAALVASELRDDRRSFEPVTRQVEYALAAGETAEASTTQASTVDEVFKTLENTRRRVTSRR